MELGFWQAALQVSTVCSGTHLGHAKGFAVSDKLMDK